MADIDRSFTHCSNCGAEYRAGFTTCADCGTTLVPGPSPTETEPGSIEITDAKEPESIKIRDADETVADGLTSEPVDWFADEEHPFPVVLTVIDEESALDLVELLEKQGIGARVGAVRGPDEAEVVIHHFRLPEAQAILRSFMAGAPVLDGIPSIEPVKPGFVTGSAPEHAELGGGGPTLTGSTGDAPDAWLEANRRIWGPEGEAGTVAPEQAEEPDEPDVPEEVDILLVSLSDSWLQAQRLAHEGIDVRIETSSPDTGTHMARLLVPAGQGDRAKRILGITV